MPIAPRRNIKSLAALFAFEAAARHRNFTAAGRELGVTQAAVSKQIGALEADLGGPLFERLPREVRLTAKGKELFAAANEALGTLGDVMARLRATDEPRPITLGATLGTSHYWLLPRLAAFRAAHPEVQIRVMSQDEFISPAESGIDMVIRFGDGRWSDGMATHLFDSSLYPAASPGFLARHGTAESAADVARLPLIEYDTPDASWESWTDWFRNAGVNIKIPKPALSFTRYFDAVEAAVADQGVLLAWGGMTGGLEERGALVRLPGPALRPKGDFYLVTAGAENSLEKRSLIEWLISAPDRVPR